VVRRRSAGRYALARWRANRRRAIRREWRLLLLLVGVLLGSLVAIAYTDGLGELIWAAIAGSMVTLAITYWAIGGDVTALAWAQGGWAEQWTEDELNKLESSWHVVHDVQRKHGNWDHIAVGPPGVFMFETKRSSTHVRVGKDTLVQGRLRIPASEFRRAAVDLRDALADNGRAPWIQAVVVIWAEFEQGFVQGDRVTYIRGEALVDWLEQQPSRLPPARIAPLAERIRQLALAPGSKPASAAARDT
jgi:hypothetical protein